jgi:hypothetical protein
MESVYFGSNTVYTHGFGEGPWVGADLENVSAGRGALRRVAGLLASGANALDRAPPR